MRTGSRTLAAARRLRREMSLPEVLLWTRLRTPGESMPRWRRQHPLGLYVLDFFCPAARLVIEVDGISHGMGDRPIRDAERDAWLAGRGLHVERVAASEVLADPDAVADGLTRLAVARAGPPPSRA